MPYVEFTTVCFNTVIKETPSPLEYGLKCLSLSNIVV